MNESDKLMLLVGSIFFPVGLLLDFIGLGLLLIFWELFASSICLLIGVVFTLIGGGILLSVFKRARARNKVMKEGQRFTGKIYGYIDDQSCTVNGSFTVNIKVHYFDLDGIEREAIIPTGFARGNGDYPIGATIDIIALDSSYTWVPGSVRFEHIPREEELMDNKPLDPQKLNIVAVSCPRCGASFSAATGYVSKCPYCGGPTNC